MLELIGVDLTNPQIREQLSLAEEAAMNQVS